MNYFISGFYCTSISGAKFRWTTLYSPQSNPDADDQLTVFTRAAEALNAVHGYEYVVGSVFDTIYPASVS